VSRELSRTEILRASQWLKEIEVRFVVVGGSAVQQKVRSGTSDVDVLILIGDWDRVKEAISKDRRATPLEINDERQMGGTEVQLGGLEPTTIEFLSAQPFSGARPPDDFVEYVRDYRSELIGGVRYATPAAVWYIRLALDEWWEAYVSKIRQDVVAGIPQDETLAQVIEIADRFGMGVKIRERVVDTKKTLRLFEPRRE
jgi:predicted nucleotidyltransferase